MASDSATHVPTQQSVKAYVDSSVAGKDNSDEITEGSTNLYYTDARSRAAISVSGDISYNSSTGVISTTGLASSDTGDLAEGSNLYFTNERVDDRVGTLIVGGTNVTATYDDAAGTLTLVSADTTYSIQDGELSKNNFTDADHSKLDAIEAAATADQTDAEIRAAVEAATDSNVFTDADHSKLDAIESTADVTDATNVAAAGAVMESDSTTAAMSFVVDEDNMASDSATKVPTQQSVKAYTDARETAITTAYQSYADTAEADAKTYADTEIAALVDSSPAAMNTLNELAAALGDDASFSTTVTNSIATKLALAGGTMSGDIAMGGNDITGGGDATFTNFNGQATTAKYADLAERYAADAVYEEGTVVSFGGNMEVTASHGYGSMKIAGVVSMKPAFAMNEDAGSNDTHPYVALQGRVPCKVMGDVSKGDILVASDESGFATKWMDADSDPRMTAYIGIAISDAVDGMVEVKVGK